MRSLAVAALLALALAVAGCGEEQLTQATGPTDTRDSTDANARTAQRLYVSSQRLTLELIDAARAVAGPEGGGPEVASTLTELEEQAAALAARSQTDLPPTFAPRAPLAASGDLLGKVAEELTKVAEAPAEERERTLNLAYLDLQEQQRRMQQAIQGITQKLPQTRSELRAERERVLRRLQGLRTLG